MAKRKKCWLYTKRSGDLVCYPCTIRACFEPHFAISERQAQDLQAATERINAVLDEVGVQHPDLAILDVGGRLMLFDVVQRDDVEPRDADVEVDAQDDPERIWEVLAVRPE
jgi:hypothetical protein